MTTTVKRAVTIAIVACAALAPAAVSADSACLPDAQKFCGPIPIGEGRVLTCLKNREASLGPACAAEFKRVGSDQTVTQ